MKKLKLDLDALKVDSFDPAPREDGEGTVFGEQIRMTAFPSCVGICTVRAVTCYSCVLSCQATCLQATCVFSCAATCVTCVTCNLLQCGVSKACF